MNFKKIKNFSMFLLFGIVAINFTEINCKIGDYCKATPDCETGEQCENGYCIKRCSRDADCNGRAGRTGACNAGYCLVP